MCLDVSVAKRRQSTHTRSLCDKATETLKHTYMYTQSYANIQAHIYAHTLTYMHTYKHIHAAIRNMVGKDGSFPS